MGPVPTFEVAEPFMLQHPFLANLVVILHLAFVAFVVLGGVLVRRWPKVAWFHLPSAIWGVWVEFARWTCPLTPLENWLRGSGGYRGGFIDHYLLHLLYPDRLPPGAPVALGTIVLVVNTVFYVSLLARPPRPRPPKMSARRPEESDRDAADLPPRRARSKGAARRM